MELNKELLLDNGFCTTEYRNVYRYISDNEHSEIEIQYNAPNMWSITIFCYNSDDEFYKTIKSVEDLQKCLDFMEVPLKIKV